MPIKGGESNDNKDKDKPEEKKMTSLSDASNKASDTAEKAKDEAKDKAKDILPPKTTKDQSASDPLGSSKISNTTSTSTSDKKIPETSKESSAPLSSSGSKPTTNAMGGGASANSSAQKPTSLNGMTNNGDSKLNKSGDTLSKSNSIHRTEEEPNIIVRTYRKIKEFFADCCC